MRQIFSYLKKNIFVIALVFSLGAYTGYKILESLGMAALLANIPIPEGSIADKDAFIKNLPEGKTLEPKQLVSVNKKAKNIILLIADGMSISQVSSYRLIKGGPNERLAVDKFPISGIVLTHSVDAIVTDSASSATAYSTGYKTNNGALGLDKDLNYLENLTEKIDQYGYVSSLISTSEITHATPAAFAAHVDLRWKTDEISKQMMDSNVITILGGGRHFFLPEEMGGKRDDGLNLYEQVETSHILLTHKDELVDVDLNTWQPLKVDKKIREGSYKQNSLSIFDHKNNIFIYKKDSISYDGEVFNPYSLIYYFRTLDFSSDENYKIQVVDNKKVTPLKFFTDKKVEAKTAFGKFYANKIWPKKINGEPFKNAGKITIWISDKDKLPIIINLKMKFGSLNLELEEVN